LFRFAAQIHPFFKIADPGLINGGSQLDLYGIVSARTLDQQVYYG
jgi:hypothetical protein